MLTIRLKRLGKKGYPVYRVVLQDSRVTPTSGKVLAYLGSYNPHTKESNYNTEKINYYLGNGAQPSDSVVRLLSNVKEIAMPKWVVAVDLDKKSKTKNPDKLRKNQPKEEPVVEETAAEAPKAEEVAAETVTEA